MCCEDIEIKVDAPESFVERVSRQGEGVSRRGFVKSIAMAPVAGALLAPAVLQREHLVQAQQAVCEFRPLIVPTWRMFSIEIGMETVLKYRQLPLRPEIQHIPMKLSEVACNQVEFTFKAESLSGIQIRQVDWWKKAYFRDPSLYDGIRRNADGTYMALFNSSGCYLPDRRTTVSYEKPRVVQHAFYADQHGNQVPDEVVKERIGQDGTIYCRYRGHFATFADGPDSYKGLPTFAVPFCTVGVHIIYANITYRCGGKDHTVTVFQGCDIT